MVEASLGIAVLLFLVSWIRNRGQELDIPAGAAGHPINAHTPATATVTGGGPKHSDASLGYFFSGS
jgi:Na+-translocating ferredoxin:NAD+ oxidoreductase RnfA subunit